MKRRIFKSVVATAVSAMLVAPAAMAAGPIEDRIKQMEAEIQELKALIRQQNAATTAKVKEVETKVETVSAAKGSDYGFQTKGKTKFSYGGYIKVNGIWTDTSDGLTAENNVTNSILVPGAIGVGDGGNDRTDFDFDVFTSRFNFNTVTNTAYGNVRTFVELDFLSGGGNEAVSNSTNPRIRHAFINWDYAEDQSLTVGQTWGTFFNVGSLPDSVDFIGPTSGSLFNRQQVIRWTKKLGGGASFQLAAENPSSNIFGLGGDIDNGSIPDLIARYNGVSGGLKYSLAVVGRDIGIEQDDVGGIDDRSYGLAANFAGSYTFDKQNTLKFSLSSGNLGRYIALSAFGDGGIDDTGNVDLTTVTGGFLAFTHKWNSKWRSTFQGAYSTASLGDGVGDTNTETLQNYNVSLVYNPLPKLDFGAAVIYAQRELENGTDGDLTRFQLTAKYSF